MKCQRVYPFFKTECSVCQFKFPKTRHGASTSIQTDSYTLQFWSKLRQDIGLFDSLTQLNEYLEDRDLMSVRDLYKKIKVVLSQENTERIFKITDTQLLDLHEQIDRKFEAMLTDNKETDDIFNRATMEKTQRRLHEMTTIDVQESLAAHAMLKPQSTIAERRENKRMAKDMRRYRPHNFELKQYE